MKNLKKVLALVVALTMVFTTVAFASYPDVDANADYAGAVELLSALDILKGDDNGNFNPDNTITRAEFAAVVCRALGWEASANGAKGATMFTDVAADHWASGYINLASQQGIINGKGNGIFDPEGNVTFTEAVKMLVVAIGFEPMAAQKGGWPTGYLTVANSIKMTAGVAASGTDAAALRSTVAMLTANAIEIPVMDQVSYGTLTEYVQLKSYSNYKTLLTAADVHKVTGTVDEILETEGKFTFTSTMPSDDPEFYTYNANNGVYTQRINNTFFVGESDVANYVGKSVNIYLKEIRKDIDYECVAVMPSGIGAELSVNIGMFTDGQLITGYNTNGEAQWNTELEYFESKDATRETKIYVKKNPMVKINGNIVTNVADLATFANTNTIVTFTENDNDKYYDIIDIQILNYAIVESVLVEKERIEFANGSKILFDFADDERIANFYNAEGAEIAFEDIAEGDVLAIEVGELDTNTQRPVNYPVAETKVTIYDLGQSIVNGTVTGWDHDITDNSGILYIDGTEYEYDSDIAWVTDSLYRDLVASGDPLGASGAFYLGLNGEIIGWDGSQSISGEYGFIIQTYFNTSSGFTNQYQVQMLTADQGIVTFNVDTTCEVDNAEYVATVNQAGEVAQSTVLGGLLGTKFDKTATYDHDNDPSTPAIPQIINRFVKYDLNKDGEIDEIYFVANMTTASNAEIGTTTEFKAATGKLGSKALEADAVVFDLKSADAKNAKVVDYSVLVDEGTYGGWVFDINKDKEQEFFVMIEGAAAFDPEANLFVVDSVTKTTYGEDAEEAVMIKYYAEGTNELLQAVFTEDSVNALSATVEAYKSLAKGSVLVANVAEDGFVVEYAVVANISNGGYALTGSLSALTSNIYGVNELGTAKRDKVEFVYGYISNIKGKTLTIGGTVANDFADGRDFVIDGGVAQYTYSTESLKAKVVVGDYQAKGVDVYDSTAKKANLVLLKVYDDEVIDIITFSNRVTLANGDADLGILAQTHWTANTTPNLNAAEEVEVEVEVEDVVEVEEIVFE